MRYVSFFTGGGGDDIGAMMAGLEPVEGYEYIPEIADWAEEQLGHVVHCQDILDIEPKSIADADFAHFSPPCPAFSVANNNKGETENDILLALKMAEIITIKKFKYLTLENVWGYRKSESWRIISSALNVVYGFGWDVNHINFADYGVPQTRKRMMVRAIKDRIIMPPLPLKQKWIGWYEAIEDIIDTLPDSQFAPWQIERMPDLMENLFVDGVTSFGEGTRAYKANRPSPTIASGGKGGRPHRAFIVSGMPNDNGKSVTVRNAKEPQITVTASSGNNQTVRAFVIGQGSRSMPKHSGEPTDTLTSNHNQLGIRVKIEGRVVAMTPRALARFQSFPDWYEMPGKKTLATTIIGNAVPPVGYAEIVKSML